MVGRIAISCIAGALACIFVTQYDPWLKETSAFYVCQHLEKNAACSAAGRLASLRFFSPELLFENVVLESVDGPSWRWQAQRVIISFSWWQLIRQGYLDVEVRLYECHATSSLVDGTVAIMAHIQHFFARSLLPITTNIKLIELHESSLSVRDDQRDLNGFCRFSSVTKKIEDTFKTVVTFVDGECMVRERQVLSRLAGKISSTIQVPSSAQTDAPKIAVRVDMSFELPQLDRPGCFITGTWENRSGRFSVRNVEELLTIDPCIMSIKNQDVCLDVVARFPLSYLWRLGVCVSNTQTVEGSCLMRMRGNVTGEGGLEGQLVIEDVQCHDHLLCSALTLTLHRLNRVMQGSVKARTRDIELGGSWKVCEKTGEASLSLTNARRCAVPGLSYWYGDVGDIQCSARKMADGLCTASYRCVFHNAAYETPFVSQGTLTSNGNALEWHGSANDNRYQGTGSLSFPYLCSFECSDAAGASLGMINCASHDAHWSGEFSSTFLRMLAEAVSGAKVQGKGSVVFDARCDDDALCVGVRLKDGIMRLPYTYNFVDNCKAQFRWYHNARTLVVGDMLCGLHTGAGRCTQGVVQFDGRGVPVHMHLPFVFDRCLFNVKKDLFAMVSGHGVLSKEAGSDLLLTGRVTVDRAQVKDTLFSFDASKTLFEKGFSSTSLNHAPYSSLWHATRLALTVETKDVAHIDTPLLQGDAHAHLAVAGTISDPTLEGDIVIDAGAITLPYKPLLITKGNIHFEPDSVGNPFIELRAKNKIKKHLVTLYAHGFLADHQVVLDASPPLTEEQIIALLLVGSPEESLNAMVPTFIMHNLKMALWGSGTLSFLDNYLKKRRVPFSINLIPSFTDQTGRGGLRGGIEITVNDQWRALIQKNFSLSEDTRFELEYLFSDDVGVRAVRDERRDIGGEVEMRWKF